MAHVVMDFTMSLDGYITGPNVSVEQPMGVGGLRLHDWIFNTASSDVDAKIMQNMSATVGAVIMGKTMFDVGVGVWEDTPLPVPCFVLTNEVRDDLPMPSGTFTFINDGIDSALRQATATAGEKHIRLMSGTVAQQFLRAGLVDEVHIQIAPILLGCGRRLFDDLSSQQIELERTALIDSARVTHMHFRVVKHATATRVGNR